MPMRPMQPDEQKAYETMKNMKDKFGTFHKTCFHLHTPASHDYTLREAWDENYYKNIEAQELFLLCLEKKIFPDKFTLEELPELTDDLSIYANRKEFLSYLLIAYELMNNEIEIVVIADHNTIEGYEKTKTAIALLYNLYGGKKKNLTTYTEVFLGIEISCADKNHVVGIIDGTKAESIEMLQKWLDENLLNQKEGTYLTSLEVIKKFSEWGNICYIAHINTSEMLNNSFLSGAYKKALFNTNDMCLLGLSDLQKQTYVESKLKAHISKKVYFVLDNDSHNIDCIDKKLFYLKGSKIKYSMLLEAFKDYDISVSFVPKNEKQKYIKGVYIQNNGTGFLTGNNEDKTDAFCLNFSDALNCIIGGRGTGKSSVLKILEYVLSQRCDNEKALEFICAHGNTWVLYVYNNKEYLVEMRMPVKEYNDEDDKIVNYFGQNPTRRYGYRTNYNIEEVKQYAISKYLKIYEVINKQDNLYLKVISDKTTFLEKFFDTSYSVNELVNSANEEKIGEFLYATLLKNQKLSKVQRLKAENTKELIKIISKIPDILKKRRQDVSGVINPFNISQKGILKIVYNQSKLPKEPNFYDWLFPNHSNKKNWYRQYNITNENVVEYLHSLCNKQGILSFLLMVLNPDVKKAQETENILSFCDEYKHKMIESGIKELQGDTTETLITQIFSSLITDDNIEKVTDYLNNYMSEIETFSLEFNINNKVGEDAGILFKPVEVLSLGQKVVAMLTFVLGYSEYSKDYRPLILDQPEDNLDNQYIYNNLVKQLRDIKEKRQVIIATHNSTIVTNAKADQVCVMKSNNIHGWIEKTGYPGEEIIKKHIVNYLEGGKESFKHKITIYGDIIK